MPRFRNVDGRNVPFTAQEEAAADAFEAARALPDCLRQLAAKRDQILDRGVTHNGNLWHADADSQHAMASAVVLGQAYEAATGQPWSTIWKTKTGFINVTLAQLVTAGLVVGGYVQAAFQREAALAAMANGGNVAGALAAIDAGWPG
jgi:hypothetical protein